MFINDCNLTILAVHISDIHHMITHKRLHTTSIILFSFFDPFNGNYDSGSGVVTSDDSWSGLIQSHPLVIYGLRLIPNLSLDAFKGRFCGIKDIDWC